MHNNKACQAKQLRRQDMTKSHAFFQQEHGRPALTNPPALRMMMDRMPDKTAGAVTPVPLTLESATTPVMEVVTIRNLAIHSQWMRQQTKEWKERSSLNHDPSKKIIMNEKCEERNLFSTARWKSNFQVWLALQRQHGHCQIPHGESKEWSVDQQKKLLRWAGDQQTHWQYRNILPGQGETAPTRKREHIDRLNSIGYGWEGAHKMRMGERVPHDQICNQNFKPLRASQQEHGHRLFQRNYFTAGFVHLGTGTWVAKPISRKKQFTRELSSSNSDSDSDIIQKRIDKLSSIGFERSVRGKDSSPWNQQFELLTSFQQEHGHCRVPRRYAIDPKLGQWVSRQRWCKKQLDKELGSSSCITQERINKLNSIGFEWKVRNNKITSWDQKFELLRTFQQEHGHCRVPNRHSLAGYHSFGQWVNKQRRCKKKFEKGLGSCGGVTQERIEKLNSVGFEWTIRDNDSSPWNQQFELLRAFQQEHGHCRVPRVYAVDPKLGRWFARLRILKKQIDTGLGSCGGITPERMAKLNSIGFEWTVRKNDSSPWNQQLEQLRGFRQEHGHCRVPRSYDVDPKLGRWVSKQRQFKKKFDKGLSRCGGITLERIEKLNSIDFVWTVRDNKITSWDQQFELLSTFQQEHGVCR